MKICQCCQEPISSCICCGKIQELYYWFLYAHFQSERANNHNTNILEGHQEEGEKQIFNEKAQILWQTIIQDIKCHPEKLKELEEIKDNWINSLPKASLNQNQDSPNLEASANQNKEQLNDDTSNINISNQNPNWQESQNGATGFDKNEEGAPKYSKNETNVYFEVEFPTQYGELVLAVGNNEKIGNWDPNRGFFLGWTSGNIWKGIASFNDTEISTLNYKYVIKKGDWVIWQNTQEWNNIFESRQTHCNVEFNIHYWTRYGETICVCGSHEKLGNWDENRALKLNWNEGGLWSNSVSIAKEDLWWIEYKYFLKKWDGSIWEFGNSRKINCSEISSNKKIFDWWQVERKSFIDFVLSGISGIFKCRCDR